jgi:hypothetical protein
MGMKNVGLDVLEQHPNGYGSWQCHYLLGD